MTEQNNPMREENSELETVIDDADGLKESIPSLLGVGAAFLLAAVLTTAVFCQNKYHWIEKARDYIERCVGYK